MILLPCRFLYRFSNHCPKKSWGGGLGLKYHAGEGVPEDDGEAVRWYRQAAEQGEGDAQYNLGLMYANGEGVMEDQVNAHAWLELAAAQGHEDAKAERNDLAVSMALAAVKAAQLPPFPPL